ncbi:MAG: threonylcarbamoyl-AMP synthase [Gammaproteobacteria bacterium]|nr:threonylcarbamoyl-AMP synthase [Gammaproteobacteria bacterium]
MIISEDLQLAIDYLAQDEIIAYPTEGVYGLGCTAFNEETVLRLLQLKNRDVRKGLILIASHWNQIEDLIEPLSNLQHQTVNRTWPGPITWVFPASRKAPEWIRGEHNTIAIRFSNHPLAQALCEGFQKPIVSTSANLTGSTPARNYKEVAIYFNDKIPFILKGEVGGLNKTTSIRDVITGLVIRE